MSTPVVTPAIAATSVGTGVRVGGRGCPAAVQAASAEPASLSPPEVAADPVQQVAPPRLLRLASLTRAERIMQRPKREIAKALREDRELRRRIEAAVSEGRTRAAKSLQRLYARSTARLVAATYEAAQRQRRRQTHQPHPCASSGERPNRMRARDVVSTALTLDMKRAPNEPVHLYARRKGAFGFRPIHVFGVKAHAQQLAFNRAVAPLLRLDPTRQFAFYGGRQAAAPAVLCHVNRGARWACEVDIISFFLSISREWVFNNLPAGRAEIRANIVPDRSRVIMDTPRLLERACYGSPWNPLPLHLSSEAERGMPQGSASSSIVAEFVVAQVLAALPPSVGVVGYVDNICLLTRTRREMERALQTLADAFMRHPAGPFRIAMKGKGIRRTDWGFDFLGYRFDSYQGAAFLAPSAESKQAFGLELMRRLSDVQQSATQADQKRALGRLRSYCRGWTEAFSLWQPAREAVRSAVFWGSLRMRLPHPLWREVQNCAA